MSVILTEKIAEQASLLFPSFLMDTAETDPDGSVDIALKSFA